MQPYFLLLLLVFFVACTSKTDQKRIEASNNRSDTATLSLRRDTFLQNSVPLVQVEIADRPQSLLTLSGDTIIKQANYYHSITFPDINEDGNKDIRVMIISNTPNQCDNYFFDKSSGHYYRIENADLDIKKVKGTDLYYSYNRAGCADFNWESHLTRIESWVELPVSRMHAKGCGEKDDGIYIYRVQEGKEQLVEKLRIDSNIQENKGAFFKSYWERHYRKFL